MQEKLKSRILNFKPRDWQELAAVADLLADEYKRMIPGDLKSAKEEPDEEYLDYAKSDARLLHEAELVSLGVKHILIKTSAKDFNNLDNHLIEAFKVGMYMYAFISVGREVVLMPQAYWENGSGLTIDQMDKLAVDYPVTKGIIDAQSVIEVIGHRGGFKPASRRLTSLRPTKEEMRDMVPNIVGIWPPFAQKIWEDAFKL